MSGIAHPWAQSMEIHARSANDKAGHLRAFCLRVADTRVKRRRRCPTSNLRSDTIVHPVHANKSTCRRTSSRALDPRHASLSLLCITHDLCRTTYSRI